MIFVRHGVIQIIIVATTITLALADAEKVEVIGTPKGQLKKGSMIYSCVECHKHVKINPKRRKLIGEHEKLILNHGDNWCYTCHDEHDRTKLKLINGQRVGFKQVVKTCAQCHGVVYRDWKAGVHGKRIGFWNGKKQAYSCNHCHDPHNPPFKPMKPYAPPRNRLNRIIHKGAHHE